MNRYKIFEITSVDDRYLKDVRRLYDDSFPEEERRPWQSILSMIENSSPFFSMRVIAGYDGSFIGFITSWKLPSAIYIEHYAISPERRSNGIGGDVITDIVAASLPLPVVLEVELPGSTPEAVRRIEFYKRNGFEALEDFPYFQPPYRPDLEMVPMMLMTSGPIADLKTFVIILHTLVYNQ